MRLAISLKRFAIRKTFRLNRGTERIEQPSVWPSPHCIERRPSAICPVHELPKLPRRVDVAVTRREQTVLPRLPLVSGQRVGTLLSDVVVETAALQLLRDTLGKATA